MPQLIITIALIWLACIVLAYVFQVAFVAAWPVLAGWLAFIASRATFRSNMASVIESRVADLIALETANQRLAFTVHPDPGSVVKPDESEFPVSVLAATAVAAAVYGLVVARGFFARITAGTGFPTEITSFVGFLMAAGGLAAAIVVTRSKTPQNRFLRRVLASRVGALNAQAARASGFDAEATRNDALRSSMGGVPEHARRALVSAVMANLHDIVNGTVSLQMLIDERTDALRAENATLTELDLKKKSLLGTYDFACREANRIGNEAVFRYLDLMARGIASLCELVAQSNWDELSQQIDGAQAELKRLLDNIDRLDEADAEEESAEEVRGTRDAADPYATLGVRPDLSNAELKNVYRLLAQIYHPDKGRVADHRKFQEIQRAWKEICAERGI